MLLKWLCTDFKKSVFKSRNFCSLLKNTSNEFTVPVPWGHIAGKEWGNPDGKKVIAVHGWLDNAGSFDTLFPLLENSLHIYAIDLPGHGRSSPLPAGTSPCLGDGIGAIHRIAEHFSLSNFIYLGHSLGAVLGYLYSATFPQKVSKYIALDNLKPIVRPLEDIPMFNRAQIEALISFDEKLTSPPTLYSYEGAIQRIIDGTSYALTRSSAETLAKRGLVESPDGKFYFSRDLKLKVGFGTIGVSPDTFLSYASNITCPILYIKTDEEDFAPLEYYQPDIEILKNRSAPFIFEKIKGTHYAHLNNPERVAPLINRFVSL